jgi:hypothetical protein
MKVGKFIVKNQLHVHQHSALFFFLTERNFGKELFQLSIKDSTAVSIFLFSNLECMCLNHTFFQSRYRHCFVVGNIFRFMFALSWP